MRRVRSVAGRGCTFGALTGLLIAAACATGNDRGAPVVRGLSIEGAKEVPAGDLKGKILTSETSWIPFSERQYFDPLTWQADLRRIERYYQARGYYQAKVLEERVVPSGNDVRLEVRVDEGRPTTVAALNVSGGEALPPEHLEKVIADLPLAIDAVFAEDRWEALRPQVLSRLRELGYAAAQVDGEAQVDVATQKATLSLVLKPGARYRFGELFVSTGPRPRVKRRRVISQAREAVVPGEWFKESALEEAQARVFRMGVFGAVRVTPGEPDPQSGTVPIVIEVSEAPFHTQELGVGLAADATHNEVRTVAGYTDRFFLGDLRRFTAGGRLGWAFLPNVYSVLANIPPEKDGLVLEAGVELEQPTFFFPDVQLRSSLQLQRGLEPAYNFYGGRLELGVVWQPHPNFSVVPSYNLEAYQLDLETGASLGARAPELLYGCDRDPCGIALSYLEQTFVWDRRDEPLAARSGYYLSLSLQEGGFFLGGSFDYLRIVPDLRAYTSFGPGQRLTLAGRVRMGTLLPFRKPGEEVAGSPVVARFFSGGDSAMRGFNHRRLSPLVVREIEPATDPATYEAVPVGGNGLVELSVEARYRLTRNLYLATFVDAGQVTVGPLRVNRLGEVLGSLYWAAGLGIRYMTPIGPVRIDVARRLGPNRPLVILDLPEGATIPSQSGCFGFGGSSAPASGYREGVCAFHLSIGEAF